MSNGRQYGGWDIMLEVFGPIHVRYQRKAGRAEKSAGYTEDGTQITEFDFGLIEKQELLPWAKEAIEQATGIRWVASPDGRSERMA
jgi:hypothetical protein